MNARGFQRISLIAAVLAAGFAASGAGAQSLPETHKDKRQQLESIQGEIAETRKREKALADKAAAVRQELSNLQLRLVRAANLIQTQEEKATGIEERVAELDGKVAELEAGLAARQDSIASTLAALQRVSRQPPELVFLRPDDSLNTVRSARLLAAVMPALREEADALRADLQLLRQLKVELDAERVSLAESLAELEKERAELDGLLETRRAEQERLQRQSRDEREKLARYAKQAQSLEALIGELEADLERRRRAAADAQARLEKRPAAKPGTGAAGLPSDTAFKEAEGTLPLPVRGRFVRQFGQPDELGNPARGLTIEARAGAQVVSPFDGEVVFAGPFRDYGRILIIAHGGGYHSLLAGMSHISAVVGQKVLAGEPVGQLSDGAGGGSPSQTRLYMELRSNGKPINPLRWLAAGKGKVSG